VNVTEIWTESVNWVSMAPDGVQLTNDGQFNELKDIISKFFFAATNLKKGPQTRHTFVEIPQF
jgi:hypothetical protein